jgi:hypothetical protein
MHRAARKEDPVADASSTDRPAEVPLVLTVPGLFNSGPGHWQTLWEQQRGDTHRVELGMWDQPHRNTWVNQLNLAIRAARRPVVLAAHSLGVIAVAWWARLEPEAAALVQGALLVAPPEVDFFPAIRVWAPLPPCRPNPCPFPPSWWPATTIPGSASMRRGVWRAAGVRGSRIWARPGISTPSRALAHGRRVRRGWTN